MFNVGGGEVLVILLLALIVLGPDKLPNAAKQAGKYLGEFRRMSQGFQDEIKSAMDLEGLTSTKPRRPEMATTNSTVPEAAPTETPESFSAVEATETASPQVDSTPIDAAPNTAMPDIIVEGPPGSFS